MSDHDSHRVRMRVHLTSKDLPEGEISFDEITKIADHTQRLIRHLARGLTDTRGPGPASKKIAEGTRLFLVGIKQGSTVLEVAGPIHAEASLSDSMPPDLDEITIGLAIEALNCLNDNDARPEMPAGIDARAAEDIASWLRVLRFYDSVRIEAVLPRRGNESVTISPRAAQQRIKNAVTAPTLPYVTMTEQAPD